MKLTKKRAQSLNKNPRVLKGRKLSYNSSQQKKYARALESLVEQMTMETFKAIKQLFNRGFAREYFASDESIASQARILMNALTTKFLGLFSSKASSLSESMLNGQEKTSKSNLHSSLQELSGGLSLKTSVVSSELEEVITASVAENVDLIKSIPEKYFTQVTGSVMRSITSGQGIKDLIPEIRKYDGMTYRRARLIALDQTRKAYNSINKQKMLSLGIKKFEWLHSAGGQHPRKSHEAISGQIFSFDTLEAEQAKLGVPPEDRGLPGYPPNCKCVMGPVLDFLE
jgi:SPP1 gp7 family putative phage head morphogenesis protein